MSVKIFSLSETRKSLNQVVAKLQEDVGPCFLTKNGRAVAALLSMATYEQLMSDLEDRLDEEDEALAQEVRTSRLEFRAGKAQTLSDLIRKK